MVSIDNAPGERRGTETGRAFELDEVLAALHTRRRRYVVYYLQEVEVATVKELAQKSLELEPDGTDVQATDVECRRQRLVHGDLPQLATLDVLEYDPASETVRYDDPPAVLDGILHVCKELER
ncbi:DUF7344 domain-containing protein [Natrialbaceae archaeon AArc-T1-2]|uniref:DUF7344 domain-containing protein n=1 Tax=Natrialbaceae archaeon AArc-T1-2 TaxID=3053904 RepID=UPI00255AD9DC|nr:hypothetical protein [Natrialbaceae archaeon AArc-T1-2]WIV68074.1 hypothetical protein QQ977_04920 [Natrialbaceae archaeon AArc-T1-2]